MYSNNLVLEMLDYIDNNLYRKITINELSGYFHYNKDYLMRLFKRELHTTIIVYINRKRIYNSLFELKNTKKSILSISLDFGFFSQEYYCETFHKVLGVTPSDYRVFFRLHTTLSYDLILKIQDSFANLDLFFNLIQKYRLNVQPQEKKKILTIFKSFNYK